MRARLWACRCAIEMATSPTAPGIWHIVERYEMEGTAVYVISNGEEHDFMCCRSGGQTDEIMQKED